VNDWLDKFDDDPRGPKKPRDPRWLEKFRDDQQPRGERPQQPQRAQQSQRPQRPQEPRDRRIPRMPPPAPSTWPQEILIFAGLMATSLVLGLTATAVAYPRLSQAVSGIEILLPDIVVIALVGGFVYLVAWLRQSWAVWLLGTFCLLRFLLYVPTFFHIDSISVRLMTACYFLLQAAAFWFVFTPLSRRWLAQGGRP
jgi:hypothetical protein